MNHDFQTICNVILFLNFFAFSKSINSFSHGDKTLPEKHSFRKNCDVKAKKVILKIWLNNYDWGKSWYFYSLFGK